MMRRNLNAFLILALMHALGSVLHAQDSLLAPGMRVRVTLSPPSTQRHIGRVETLTDTALVLSDRRVKRTIPLAGVLQVESSEGRRANLLAGGLGLLAGAAIGAAAGCAANRDSYGVFCGGQSDTKVAVGAGLGGVAGAALGAFVFRRERWTRLNVQRMR